ncbi:MAG: DUF177 domain-containing protein [Desulfovibrionaceae bacterium]|nr:DUF177 domain-containing protein [Desulfovibrionaceae bacterium]
MRTDWLPLSAALNQGGEIILTDQSIWLAPLEEFKIDCRIAAPLEARLRLLPQEGGLLAHGHICGAIILPCSRCAEETRVELRRDFDSYEPFPPLETDPALADTEVDQYFIRWSPVLLPPGRPGKKAARRRPARETPSPADWSGLEINPANLAWEEFAQALPQFPLCREDCSGLCPGCGQNLNQGPCGCKTEYADPRLEKLRGLKLNK